MRLFNIIQDFFCGKKLKEYRIKIQDLKDKVTVLEDEFETASEKLQKERKERKRFERLFVERQEENEKLYQILNDFQRNKIL